MIIDFSITLPNHLRGRVLNKRVIPTVCNLKNMLRNLGSKNWEYKNLKLWERPSYKAYHIDKIQKKLEEANKNEYCNIIRNHILNHHPEEMGASCIDIYLIAYVAETYGTGKEKFHKYITENSITNKPKSVQAIWQVGKGDGEFLGILKSDGSIRDWNFVIQWIRGK